MSPTEKRKLQDRFLSTCRNSPKSLADVLDDLGISHKVLDAWLEELRFRRKVQALRKALSRQRELELERGATQSAQRMTRFAIGAEATFPERERRACMDLMRFWNAMSNRKIVPRYNKGSPRQGKRRPLIHPSAEADAPMILRRMRNRN